MTTPKTARATGRAGRASGSKKQPPLVFSFARGKADGDRSMKDLLGGKGANLAEMCNLGLPVPPGFTISTEVCTWFDRHGGSFPRGLRKSVEDALAKLEKEMDQRFGDPDAPLLVSVRSGARVSMPGMMDTVLNLGLNETTVEGLARRSGNPRFAWDAYRRFVQMYGDVVLGIKADDGEDFDPFHRALSALQKRRGVKRDTDLDADDLRALVATYKKIVLDRTGKPFPEDPKEQLWGAIAAVFASWNNERAIAYRHMNHIPGDWGTAVSVVAMVFGNMGPTSGTGVAFTRDPATGEKRFYGEYLMNAQGEDVVAGIRTPAPIEELEESSPAAWRELQRIQKLLERHYRDMQDLEFTIQDGKLYMLQCRVGKRTGFAAVRIAVDLVKERRITKREALERVDPEALNQLLQPVFDPAEKERASREGRILTRGLPAGPGAATGRIVFRPERAVEVAERGVPVLLVREETSPEDISGMQASRGILTARGGMTSHAALVARQMGKVCVAGAGELVIDTKKARMRVGEHVLEEGDWISLDGSTGEVIAGEVPTRPSEVIEVLFGKKRSKKQAPGPVYEAYSKLMKWADEVRTMGVRTNADQPDQCRVAVAFGAEGIGLCRTEHMFFEESKIEAVREMILSDGPEERRRALKKLLPLQRRDFEGIFKAMDGRPVTVRTLDPPLHEFLPHEEREIKKLAQEMGVSRRHIESKIAQLAESNPMLGHRGCRLGISYPEITRMQTRALFEAACNVAKRTGKTPHPELMIPLVGTARELELQAADVREVAENVFEKKGIRIPYLLGTMIELPRAALTAGEIAEHAEFFSFGTNDLTQTTFGISRDDAGTFIPAYIQQEIFPADPFAKLDRAGTGRLMRIACDEGRATRPKIKLGICGEHGGDPSSIEFCQELGLDYVSCSPYRVPIARLAAAQAALRSERSD
ncbi:MAG TPA: pyruvate, phosphate dikinase [Planctomycetes bacterium]|nr:pyruvate, phosphate dikinase [Planctomycetota bacterium]